MDTQTKPRKRTSFLEWVSVAVILAVLLGIIWAFIPHGYDGKGVESIARLTTLHIALEQYNQEWGYYPASELIQCSTAWLDGLTTRDGKPYVDRNYLRVEGGFVIDSYGNPIRYQSPGVHNPEKFDISSPGKNGKFEPDDPNADDLSNWRPL